MQIIRGASLFIDLAFLGRDLLPMAATGVELRAMAPDGRVTVLPLTPGVGVGEFSAEMLPTTAGVWKMRATCAGPVRAVIEGRATVLATPFPAETISITAPPA